MDAKFWADLVRTVFTFSSNILQSILVYIGIAGLFFFLFPSWRGKMKGWLEKAKKYGVHIAWAFILISVVWGSYTIYDNKNVAWATTPELQASYLSNLNIKMADLGSTGNPIISSRVFENCEFYGPAVVIIHDNCVGMVGIAMLPGITMDTALIPTTTANISGIFIFDNCVFKGICKLNNVSIIGSPEVIEKLKEKLRQESE
jgi:hypothetical protein